MTGIYKRDDLDTYLVELLQDPKFAEEYNHQRSLRRISDKTSPWIGVDPAMRAGDATIRGTRLPVWAVVSSVFSGESVAAVADDYDITRADVLCACWYVGMYGLPDIDNGRRYKRVLREWAQTAGQAMWHASDCDYDAITDPPIS